MYDTTVIIQLIKIRINLTTKFSATQYNEINRLTASTMTIAKLIFSLTEAVYSPISPKMSWIVHVSCCIVKKITSDGMRDRNTAKFDTTDHN